MELTVCICVRDGAAYVDKCLQALVDETAPFRTPIVVVDHASRDHTPQLLARWASEQGERLSVLRFEGDGLAAARDFAWRQSRTPWVAFVDIDCVVQPGWAAAVSEALKVCSADRHCGAFGGTNRVPQDGRLLYRAYAVLLPTYVGGHDSILNRPLTVRMPVAHCPTLNVVYRRSALEDVGGFDQAYTRVCEDLEVSRRLIGKGYTLWVNPNMVVDHALRPTLRSWLRNMFLYGRGNCFHMKRHPEAFHPKFLAPAAVVLAYLSASVWCVAGGGAWLPLALLAGVHLAAIALLLFGEARRQGQGAVVWLAASLVVWFTHLSFGAGLLFELPRRRDRFVR
ncbi:MAG: glycosyltransferase [Deltaproteobacteria bacterium]|nr:glycosyltransferase [Deltaproteobacteria bacterium]